MTLAHAHSAPARPAESRATAAQAKASPKPRIGSAEDPLEREADRIADQVMSGGAAAGVNPTRAAAVQRTCAACGGDAEDLLQRKCADGAAQRPGAAEAAVRAVSGAGRPLPPDLRAYFEPRFGRDLSGVRVHTDAAAAAAARSIGARAYTFGPDLAFAAGEFDPSHGEGRRLIAHELAHVAQQTAGPAPSRDTVRRTPDDAAGEPAGIAEAPTAEPTEANDVTVVHDRVDRIVISCARGIAAFETEGGVHMYRLSQCDRSFPEGDYTARVAVNPKEHQVGLTFDTGGGHGRVFRGGFQIKKGQVSPVELLKDQDRVAVRFGGATSNVFREKECLLSLEPRTIVNGKSDSKDLAELLPKPPTLTWPLADVGLAGVELRLGVQPHGKVAWRYDDAKLDDICLSRLEGQGIRGRANFTFGAQVDLNLGVSVGAEIAAHALGFDVLTVHGDLSFDADAAVRGEISQALVEIDYQAGRDKSLKLKTDLDFAALAALSFNVSASAGIDFLGFNLWKGHLPNLGHGETAYAWTGGLTFDESFVPQLKLGTLAKAGGGKLKAGALRSRDVGRPAKTRESLPIRELVTSWVMGGEGEVETKGTDCDSALPIHWFKPRDLYPAQISFGRADVSPTEVARDGGPVLVSHPTVQPPAYRRWGRMHTPDPIAGPTPIGVDAQNWPETGEWAKCFQYIPSVKSRKESTVLRQLLRGLDARFDSFGPDDVRVQMDHVRELQFGGADRFDNLWPFDASANPSAGTLHQKQIEAYHKLLKGGAVGRYFKIGSIGLDPEKQRRLGG